MVKVLCVFCDTNQNVWKDDMNSFGAVVNCATNDTMRVACDVAINSIQN